MKHRHHSASSQRLPARAKSASSFLVLHTEARDYSSPIHTAPELVKSLTNSCSASFSLETECDDAKVARCKTSDALSIRSGKEGVMLL